MSATSPDNLDKAFALLCECAAQGQRCPVSRGPDAHPFLQPLHTSALAAQGKIRIEIYAHNWRVVTILVGLHKGKRTAPSPHKNARRPYQVIDANASSISGRPIDRGASKRQQPWSPPRLSD